MHKIIFACSQTDRPLAEQVQRDLETVGIELDIRTDQAGALAPALLPADCPVLLLVSGAFLTSAGCLLELLPVLQEQIRRNRLITVLGKTESGESDASIPLRIDRMSDLLHYLNYWQNTYLNLITQQQQLPAERRSELEPKLQEAQLLTGQIGNILTALRDTLCFSWQQITGADYQLLFQQIELPELSAQYQMRKQPHPVEPRAEQETPPAMQETARVPLPPAGPVRFTPVEPEDAGLIVSATTDAVKQDLSAETLETESDFSTLPPSEAEIQRTIDDAWLWIRNGYLDRGLEVFQLALEQYPQFEQLRSAYLLALAKFAHAPEEAERQLEILHDNGLEEAKSYDLMGEIAQTKGDYLFAKYAWDRALQINPNYPGLYRKLGLMTSEHLPDYRDTATHYLKAALAQEPQDIEVNFRLGQLLTQLQEPVEATIYLKKTLELDPLHGLAKGLLEKLTTPLPAETVVPPPPSDLQEPRSVLETLLEQPQTPTLEITTAAPEKAAPKRTDIKTVLITGASSGIGMATAEIFAQHGHRVILTGRRLERLEMLKNRFYDLYRNDVLVLSFDLRDPLAVEAAIRQLPEDWKQVDILINNAGLAKGLAPIHEGSLEHWETMIDTNIKGLLYITRLIAPGMVERRNGHIINIGSSAGKETYPNGNVYCATKFAVDALTKAIRMDLYTHNVRVSQVSPGHVEETEFALTRFDGDAERARIYDQFQPLKASDVAETIYFIASRPPHVNIQDVFMYGSQQASATMIDRSGRQ
ncbi:MAG: SDR family NAD(P)-dependent oxidoreductase [Saprospiraceae bacterium]